MLSSRSLLATSFCVLSVSISSPMLVEGRGQFVASRDVSSMVDSMMFSDFPQELSIPMAVSLTNPCEGLKAANAQDWVTCAKAIGNVHTTLPPTLTHVLQIAEGIPELMPALQTALTAATAAGGPAAAFAINFVFALADKAASNGGTISVSDVMKVAAESVIPGEWKKFIPPGKLSDWIKTNMRRVLPKSKAPRAAGLRSTTKPRSKASKRPARRVSEADADVADYETEPIPSSYSSPPAYDIDDRFSEVFEELETIRELLREINKTRHQSQIAREEEEEEEEEAERGY